MTPKQKQAEQILEYYNKFHSFSPYMDIVVNLLSSYAKGELIEVEKCSDCDGCGNIMIEHGDIQHPAQCLKCNGTGKQPKGAE